MDKDNLSPKERTLLDQARREAAALKAAPPTAKASGQSEPQPKVAPTAAERLAQLMAEERAETELRKKKARRYGIAVSLSILAIFALWVFRATRRR